MSSIVEEIKSIQGQKIVSYYSLKKRGNFDMTNDNPTTISMKRMKELFKPCMFPTMVIVRQFTPRKDEETGMPWKNLYAYIIHKDGLSPNYKRLLPTEYKEMYLDGKKEEEFVVFC